jgi:hypothetical protein
VGAREKERERERERKTDAAKVVPKSSSNFGKQHSKRIKGLSTILLLLRRKNRERISSICCSLNFKKNTK